MAEENSQNLGEDGSADPYQEPENGQKLPLHKDFSAWNREISQQRDPETGEPVRLLTKKQLEKEKTRLEKLEKKLEAF